MEFSIKHIDYLSRAFLDDDAGVKICSTASNEVSIPSQSSITLMQLSGVSRFWERTKSERENKEQTQHRYRMEEVLIGCHGAQLPLVFLVRGSSSSPEIQIDIGSLEPSAGIDRNYGPAMARHFISRSLPGHYPGIQTVNRKAEEINSLIGEIKGCSYFGMVTGIPAIKVTDETDDPTQIDRLIRTMYGSEWGLLIIAQPVSHRHTNLVVHSVLNEMRLISNAEQTKQTKEVWAPLARSYYNALEQALKEFEGGKNTGLWAATIYYFSTEELHFLKLGSAIRAYYGGDATGPDPVRAFALQGLPDIVARFGQPVLPPEPGPGFFKYPFQYQTLLNSNRLAIYLHLPRLEIPGFSIKQSCYFDVVSHHESEVQLLELGEILHYGGPIGSRYKFSADSLQKHALIVGVTGSGKTNTTFHLLNQLWELGIPFLVLEPAKTEYRALLTDQEIGSQIRIFTLGEEKISPLRMNPFEVDPVVSVATHIDLLKSVFNASFGMWNPLPQVLERCIYAIYRDRGWDTTRNINSRLEPTPNTGAITPNAYPTLTDLYEKIDEVVSNLGYDDRVESDIKAALMTRINSLRVGSKGIMLDTHQSISTAELLSKPTIIELEQIGDDDEKAFLMGLLMTKIYEYLRGYGSTEGTALKHVVVIEEAHRLLSNVPAQASQEQSNIRGKAVETFTNMLSEIRAYGEGFMVAEQIAVKLSLDVIKNTNLKIVHRTVAGEDRRILGETMNMDNRQCDMLAVLKKGQAAVFVEGDDKPIMVAVPYAKIEVPQDMKTKAGSDARVALHMKAYKSQSHIAALYTPFKACTAVCSGSLLYCDEAKDIVEAKEFKERFAAFVLSIVVKGALAGEDYLSLLRIIRSRLSQNSLNNSAFGCVILNALRWYFDYFGRRYNWSYNTVSLIKNLLSTILLERLPEVASSVDGIIWDSIDASQFSELYRTACRRGDDPFPTCSDLCVSGECLYRYHNELLIADTRLTQLFDEGMAAAVNSDEWPDMRAILQAISRLNGENMAAQFQRSIGLCYGVLQITYKPGLLETARDMAINRLLEL
jgi:hypothetical protein